MSELNDSDVLVAGSFGLQLSRYTGLMFSSQCIWLDECGDVELKPMERMAHRGIGLGGLWE
jgi:hypothetical protein